MGKSPKAPAPDARIGEAAMLSAQTGQDALAWAKKQAEISNDWAAEDRARYKTTFQPVEDQFVADSVAYDTPERRAAEAASAAATVRAQGAISRGIGERNLSAMGVNPNSGRFAAETAKAATTEGLAAVGAANAAEKAVEAEGRSRIAQAVNLGQGMAVNPGTSLGLSTSAGMAGFGAAQQGYGQQGQLLNAQHQQAMQAYQSKVDGQSALWGGLGSLAGVGLSILSDETKKTNRKKVRGALKAIDRMPIDKWDYKPGAGDEGTHVGPMARDFKRETGLGDGTTINVIDAIGTTMGAVKELSAEVRALKGRVRGTQRQQAAA